LYIIIEYDNFSGENYFLNIFKNNQYKNGYFIKLQNGFFIKNLLFYLLNIMSK